MSTQPTTQTAQKKLQVERVIRYIDRLIGLGQLKPGDAVSEPEVGQALGVGRVPVREAIRILAGEGLLELAPYRGARVKTVDTREILEILEVLTSLSITAIHRLTAQPIDEKFAQKIVETGERIMTSATQHDAMGVMTQISIFHNMIITVCGNRYLLELVKRTRIKRYIKHLVEILGPNAFQDAAPNYPKIAHRILQQDGTGAGKILRRTVDKALSYAAERSAH